MAVAAPTVEGAENLLRRRLGYEAPAVLAALRSPHPGIYRGTLACLEDRMPPWELDQIRAEFRHHGRPLRRSRPAAVADHHCSTLGVRVSEGQPDLPEGAPLARLVDPDPGPTAEDLDELDFHLFLTPDPGLYMSDLGSGDLAA